MNRYIKEPDILNYPPNDDNRFVLQTYKTSSPNRKKQYYSQHSTRSPSNVVEDDLQRIHTMNSADRTYQTARQEKSNPNIFTSRRFDAAGA